MQKVAFSLENNFKITASAQLWPYVSKETELWKL